MSDFNRAQYEPFEYCTVHDRPLDWCPDEDWCRAVMKSWGLYPDREPSG